MTTLALNLCADATLTSTTSAARPNALRRAFAHRWDLVGVLALLGSSASYAVYALAHLAA